MTRCGFRGDAGGAEFYVVVAAAALLLLLWYPLTRKLCVVPAPPRYRTVGNIQWFYFSVSNVKAGTIVRFNLVNHNKGDSLFNYGLLPLVYSDFSAAFRQVGWRRAGMNVCYYQSRCTYRKRKR